MIVKEFFNEFINKKYEKITKSLSINIEHIKNIEELIKEQNPRPGSLIKDSKSNKFYRGIKKQSNRNTGYKGRTAIHEIIEVNSEIRKLIFDGASQNKILDSAIDNGMTTLRKAGIGKVFEGITTIEEVVRSTVRDD